MIKLLLTVLMLPLTIFSGFAQLREAVIEKKDGTFITINTADLYRIYFREIQEVEIILATDTLNVPKEGGTYAVTFKSTIPLYLEPQNGEHINSVTNGELYEGITDYGISSKCNLENNTLNVIVRESYIRNQQSTFIPLYDGEDNIVARLNIIQEANMNPKIHPLGNYAKLLLTQAMKTLSEAFCSYNVLEQYYYFNKQINKIPLNPNDAFINKSYTDFFKMNRLLLTLKDMDVVGLDLYTPFFDVFYAMYYYSMVVVWGDIPYNYGEMWTEMNHIPRTSKQEVLDDLKKRLVRAIDQLEEKKNDSQKDIDATFFVSKDVARIVLANIYMYENDWVKAKQSLDKVISNNYYQLDARSEYDKLNSGLIFGLAAESGIKDEIESIVISVPNMFPLQTLTDVYLSIAECEYHLGNTTDAELQLIKIADIKELSLSGDLLTQIKEIRGLLLLQNTGYFAFLKRNNLAIEACNLQEYQLLFPLPSSQVYLDPAVVQNPGY